MISFTDALAHIADNRPPQAEVRMPLSSALGMRLAQTVVSTISRPPADVSAMDGYAVHLDDVRTPGGHLHLIGEAPAGRPFKGRVHKGEAVRLFTGSEVPTGADHILIQEYVRRDGDTLHIEQVSPSSDYIRKAGLDFAKGDIVLTAGTELGPAELAIAAAANLAALNVWRKPRIGLLANGDELRPPGSDLETGQIVNSNPAGLCALIRNWGGEPIDLGIAPDRPDAIQSFIEGADDADIIVPIGGASVGDHDHMRAAFAGLGFQNVFEKIAVKPGKPTWFALKGHQRVLGLPGNPASAFVCAHLFLKPLIQPESSFVLHMAKLGSPVKDNGPRAHFMRAAAEIDRSGQLIATPLPNQDSSLLTPFLTANALIYHTPDAKAAKTGEHIQVLLIGSL